MTNQNFFKKNKILPVDKFFNNVLFDKKKGYYTSKVSFGRKGDFITAPGISYLFSETIGIWIITAWNAMGQPKKFNLVELGPGDGNLIKVLIKTFKKFPKFEKSLKIYLYEKSDFLKSLQKKNIFDSKIKWINNFNQIKNGPTIFFGNEFFDAIPIKQFKREKNLLYEKYYSLDMNDNIHELFKKAKNKENIQINKFKTIKKLKFIEFPKLGLIELKKITAKISKRGGGLLLIDYGYLASNNKNTLQSVIKHKRNSLLENLGKADITSLVNFNLLKEFFLNNNLKVKKIVTQKFFLERMGIIERADRISKKMSFSEKSNLYLRLKRLLDNKFMGGLFKVIFAYKFKKNKFLGFQ